MELLHREAPRSSPVARPRRRPRGGARAGPRRADGRRRARPARGRRRRPARRARRPPPGLRRACWCSTTSSSSPGRRRCWPTWSRAAPTSSSWRRAGPPLRVRAEHEVVLGPAGHPGRRRPRDRGLLPAVALLLDRAAAAGVPDRRHRARRGHPGRDLPPARRHPPRTRARGARACGCSPRRPCSPGWSRPASAPTPASAPARATCPTGTARWPRCSTGAWTSSSRRRSTSSPGSRCSAAGFSLDDVEAVVAQRRRRATDVLPALGALVDQSLVLRVPAPDDAAAVPAARAGAAVRDAAPARVGLGHRDRRPARRALPRARDDLPRSRSRGRAWRVALDRLEADHANLRSLSGLRRPGWPCRRQRPTPRTSGTSRGPPTNGSGVPTSARCSTGSRPTTPTCARRSCGCSSSTGWRMPSTSRARCGCTWGFAVSHGRGWPGLPGSRGQDRRRRGACRSRADGAAARRRGRPRHPA